VVAGLADDEVAGAGAGRVGGVASEAGDDAPVIVPAESVEVTFVSVAMPLLLVRAVPTDVPSRLKETVSLGIAAPLAVARVATSVAGPPNVALAETLVTVVAPG